MCDVGYYTLSGACHKCEGEALVFFLSRTIPALGVLGFTAFLFFGGMSALMRRMLAATSRESIRASRR
jgi:hypothetical protein